MLRLESQSSAGLRMQPYPRAPDLVWPGHLHGTGCLSARAVGTGFPTVGLRLWLGPGCVWWWVLFTPACCGWGLGRVCLGSVCGVVPLLPAVCGVRGWALVSACFRDLCGFVRVSLALRRFRFQCAVWACVLGPGLGCAPPFLAGLSGCVFCAFFFFRLLGVPVPGLVVSPPVSFLSGWAAGFFFFFLSACFGAPFPAGPLFLAWCRRFWLGGPPVPVWGSCLRCPLGGGFGPLLCCWRRFGGCGLFSRAHPPPLFFFLGGGGGRLAVPPFAFPRLALALWLVCGVVGPSPLLAEVPVCFSPPLLAGFRCRWWWAVPATPGWGLPAAVVCGGGVLVGLWLVCGVVGPSPLLAEVPVCYSPPLLAGFRCRWWWAVPATPGWGPLAASVCGVWRWCVVGVVVGVWCGWSLATPGGGPCVLLPATPGWVSLPVVVGGPRHSWLGSAGGGGVWCVVWCVVCCWGSSPLLAEVPVCYSPPLLAGSRCRWWWAVPATPGWGPLAAVVCVLCLAGSGGPASWARSGAPHPFLWPLCLSALLGPLRAGVAPLSFAAVAVPRWLFFSASRCLARASFVSPAWPLAALWWLLPRPPPTFVSGGFRRSCLWPLCFFFFSPSSSSSVRPRCLRLSLVSGPGCPGPRRLRCLFCWPSASWLSVRLSLFRAFRLAVGCSRVVAAPPPPLCRAVFVPAARCCVPCCAVRAWVRCCAALLRVVSPGVVLSCAVLRSLGAAACCAVPSGAARRPGALCSAALCFAVFPRAVCSVLCVFCRGVVVRAVFRRSALCCVCLGVLCCAFSVLSVLCGAELRCAGALALCCSCGACCCWRLVLWCAAVCCAVSCGVPWCGAGSGGPWLSAGGVFRCRCPCLAAWSASLWLVWFAVVPCFPVLCSVVLCCRVVLCCCALLSCCGAVGACFALLWAVVLCCVVLLVGCAVFGPVVVSACCGALFLALCVPCLLRSVRCGALLCWLWCPASLCRVLWRCAVVWCCAVVLCCRFAVLFVFALPSCGLSCGARVVCAVVGASCCGMSLCVVVSPWAFCGVVVLLWCVVVSCCAVRCPVVSCALCRVLRCRAVLRCCAGWLCCAVVCAAGVCFVLFSFAKNPCRFSVPFKTLFFFFLKIK